MKLFHWPCHHKLPRSLSCNSKWCLNVVGDQDTGAYRSTGLYTDLVYSDILQTTNFAARCGLAQLKRMSRRLVMTSAFRICHIRCVLGQALHARPTWWAISSLWTPLHLHTLPALGRDCNRELRAMSSRSILLPSPSGPLEQNHLPPKDLTTCLSTVIYGHLGQRSSKG